MTDFKWRHYQGQIILGCVRWYCKYGISYRDLEEMMCERGVEAPSSCWNVENGIGFSHSEIYCCR